MNTYFKILLYSLPGILLSLSTVTGEEERTVLFNGKNFDGWTERNQSGSFRVEDGTIIGTAKEGLGTTFLCTNDDYADFELEFETKLIDPELNTGVQIRSANREPKGKQTVGPVEGPQVEIIANNPERGTFSGNLYGEGWKGWLTPKEERRHHNFIKGGQWNHFRVLARGDQVTTWINGNKVITTTIPAERHQTHASGFVGLQVHSIKDGTGPFEVAWRNIRIRRLSDESKLDAKLKAPADADSKPAKTLPAAETKTSIKPRPSTKSGKKGVPDWPSRIAAADPGSQGEAWAKPDFDDSIWKTMKLPGHFEKAGLPDFDGVVWFRKTVTLTADQAAAKASVHLGQIDDMDVSWVNGRRVGGYEVPRHHFTVRIYPVPAGVLRAGENTIAVRVMDHGSGGGIAGKPEQLALRLGTETISLATSWRYAPGATLAVLTGTTKKTTTTTPKKKPPTRSKPYSKETEETFPTDIPEAPLPEKAPRFTKGFVLEAGDIVAFFGSGSMVKQVESGELEGLLTHSARGQKVLFRDMSWQADTVYQQQRPRNFGTQASMLGRIGGTVIVAAFGQMEAMAGEKKLKEFIQAYESLLNEFVPRTEKIVLITPHPFAKNVKQPHFPDLTQHNNSVRAYAEAIGDLAERRGWVAVNMSRFDAEGLSMDGLQLTPEGEAKWAKAVALQLVGESASELPSGWEAVHKQIQKKNELWRLYRRPTNWGFVYGNLQHVPSSHDHRPDHSRWFPKEVAEILPLVEESENKIFNLQLNY